MNRLILTLSGPDRPGLVADLSETVRSCQGNWRTSRLAHLAGRFAGVVECDLAVPTPDFPERVRQALGPDFSVSVHPGHAAPAAAGPIHFLEIQANDRPGIVREVTEAVSAVGANIEEWESRVCSAPMSGTPLFEAKAVLRLPGEEAAASLRLRLEALSPDLSASLLPADP